MSRHKITLLEENCWVLRSTKTRLDGTKDVKYFMTIPKWTHAPTAATIFHDEETGDIFRQMVVADRPKDYKGWADGSTEVLDVVPLYGEILTSPNAKKIQIKK